MKLDRATKNSPHAFYRGVRSGPHRCAGEHIAIAESDVFMRRLLAVEGWVIVREPKLGYGQITAGYELSNFIIAIDKTSKGS